jgi:hypothetical protein
MQIWKLVLFPIDIIYGHVVSFYFFMTMLIDLICFLKFADVVNLFLWFSVLVHSGGVHGGHYYAFIRPALSDQWCV